MSEPPKSPLDHDDFGLNQSKIIERDRSKKLERDAGGKPLRTFPHPALAVALSYEAPHAPKVVAMGRGWLGQKIIDTAREHGVPLREDPALAEALSGVELDTEIPEALYAVVAKVIAFVLRTQAAARGDGA